MKMSKNDALLLEELEYEYGKDVLANAILTIAAKDVNSKENITNNEIILDYIKKLEGFRIRFRELHWDTNRHSRHILADSIIDKINDYEDSVAEDYMGMIGVKIKIGTVIPIMPKSNDITAIDEMLQETFNVLNCIGDNIAYTGICNALEDFVHEIYKIKYLSTLE